MSAAQDLRSAYGSLTSDDVAALDRAAVAAGGITVAQLMEIAGWQVARCAWMLLGERPAAVLAVAGRGNNGGDALVAARHLRTWGCEVRVHRAGADDVGEVPHAAGWASLTLDGILGTGLRSSPREPQADVIRALNEHAVEILAIDVPSGLDATTGSTHDPCIRASATCTLGAMKAGLWAAEAAALAGDVWVADIGMPAEAWAATGLPQPTAVRGGALLPVPTTTEL